MKQTTEAIRFAGDVAIRKLELISSSNAKIDITNQLIGIEVYEDIFSPFITMAISIRESLDFINAIPLRGEELIDIEISTPTYTDKNTFIKDRFYVYKLSDRQLLTDRNTAYTLHVISYEALIDLNMKQSKAYSGNISEIAKLFFKTDGFSTTKGVNVEVAKNSTKYISNYWSPVKNLNFLSTSAINKNNSPSFLFYENRYGFNFISLDTLYDQDVYQKFYNDDYVRDTTSSGTAFRNIEREYQRVLEVKTDVTFDSLKHINKGTYASRIYSYDLVKKKYFAKDYNALDEFPVLNHLNKYALYTNAKPVSPVNYILHETKHYASHDGYADTSNVSFVQRRNHLINAIRTSSIEITVYGRTDYTVGQKVYLQMPKPASIHKEDSMDTNNKSGVVDGTYTGNYIITAINHIINRDSHTCVMELSKESMIG